MLFMIKYQAKADNDDPHSHFMRCVYAECDAEPAWEKVFDLVRRVSGGDFATESVVIEESAAGRDPNELDRLKLQTPVYRI